jgi:benzoyl-CoA reductase/2-hydroxyglutaryl-CoA dehydratase subunit BcrC/BadD/HgdB
MEKKKIIDKLHALKQSGKPVIGCFPLYPPLELFHAMGLVPVVLWGLKGIVRETPHSDKHLQPYACSVVRHLTEFLLTEGRDLIDGIWMYNACDTLRNLPEIFMREFSASGKKIPLIRMHIPMAPQEQTDSIDYLRNEIRSIIRSIQEYFGASFSDDGFKASLARFNRMRKLALKAEQNVAEGRLGFWDFASVMQDGWLLPVEDHIAALESLPDERKGLQQTPAKNNSRTGVIVSGILPPPESVISAIESAGLRVVGNDIASLRRSYADVYESPAEPVDHYQRFYMNHYPCPTLLYTDDRRLDQLEALVHSRGARGVVFVGEKFCEYEYFEFPYIEKRLKENGISSLVIEIAMEDELHTSAHLARIEAFAEMIRQQ